MLAEFGVFIASGLGRVISFAQGVAEGVELELPTTAQDVFRNLCQQLGALHEQVRWYEARLRLEAKLDVRVRFFKPFLASELSPHQRSPQTSVMDISSEIVVRLLRGLD